MEEKKKKHNISGRILFKFNQQKQERELIDQVPFLSPEVCLADWTGAMEA